MCKMWSTKNGIMLFCLCYIGCVSLSEEYNCDLNYKIDLNKSEDGPEPGGDIFPELRHYESGPALEVFVAKRRADFNFTVLFIPSIKNESECPELKLIETKDLLQYEETCLVYKDKNESLPIYFWQISTGCYYFIEMNANGNNWVWDPTFYNTSLPSYYTGLKLEKYLFKPATLDKPMELNILLKIPLSCIQVRVQLFQLDEKIKSVTEEIRNSNIQPSQECWFEKNDTEVKRYKCKMSELVTNLTLEVRVHEDNTMEKEKEWTADVLWKWLQHGGGTYYLWVKPYTSNCEKLYGHNNVTTWIPFHKDIFKELGIVNDTDLLGLRVKPGDGHQNLVIICILCISLSVIVLAILAYWKYKHFTAFCKNPLRNETNYVLQGSGPLCDEKESNDILLMYARDSPEFMNEMNKFRSDLKRACHCHVYDLYMANEWRSITCLGPDGWVDKLMGNKTKIVWVDTPRFRSRFSDQRDNYFSNDFRDNAIPYAVALAKILFQDANTQYRYLFVVRVEGFEVDDELGPNPLLVFSPHVRFHIPGDLELLCKHLSNSTMQSKRNGEDLIENL